LAAAPLRQIQDSFPRLHRPETFVEVREAAASEVDPRKAKRLNRLAEFLATRVEDALAGAAWEAIQAQESKPSIAIERQPASSLKEALVRLKSESIPEQRRLLERRVGEWLWERQDWQQRRLEAAEPAARTLGFDSYVSFRDEFSGYSSRSLAEECNRLLAATEDAYRDVLGYVLKRADPSLRPLPTGSASLSDLEYAQSAPWMSAWFLREELIGAVQRSLAEMGLGPEAEGRIHIDDENRSGKEEGSLAAKLKVPDDIRVVHKPAGGIEALCNLLGVFGRAQHAARTARSAPLEDRRLGDSSVPESYAKSFEHLALDKNWHRRYLRLPNAAGRESARLAAFQSLVRLRRYCALLPYEITLYDGGPLRSRAEEYQARHSSALFVSVQRGFFLRDVEPQLYSSRRLRGWALEVQLRRTLRERFNEDYWRNPATGEWLAERFARGQRDDADSLAADLGQGALRLEAAGTELVQALNA
jgi:hypothetical protein